MFFCPGNHDVQRKVLDTGHTEQSKIILDSQDRDSLNSTYEKGMLGDLVRSKFSSFFEFTELLRGRKPIYDDHLISVQYHYCPVN